MSFAVQNPAMPIGLSQTGKNAGGTFAITAVDIGHKPGAPGGLLAFEVDNLDAEVARLKGLQVPLVRDTMTTPVCRMAVIADPDGNHITLHQRNA